MDIKLGPIIGKCQKMCSEREIKWRIRQGLVHPLETSSLTLKPDREKMVKEFVRSAVGQRQISDRDVRPVPVLLYTIDYLLKNVFHKNQDQWNITYDFIANRLRAVRQDMIVQDIKGESKIILLEKSCIFYLLSSYRLIDSPINIFDPHLNNNQLFECLETLMSEYNECSEISEKRVIFESIYTTLHLGSPLSFTRFHEMGPIIRSHIMLKLVFKLTSWHLIGNFYRILEMLKCLPIVIKLCLTHHIHRIQTVSLNIISKAFKCSNARFPIKELFHMLVPFEDYNEDHKKWIIQLCQNSGLNVLSEDIIGFSNFNYEYFICPRKWESITKHLQEENNFLHIFEKIDNNLYREFKKQI